MRMPPNSGATRTRLPLHPDDRFNEGRHAHAAELPASRARRHSASVSLLQ